MNPSDKCQKKPESKLVSSLTVGVAAGLGSALYQALVDGIADIDYFRATTIGVIGAFVFFLLRISSAQKSR